MKVDLTPGSDHTGRPPVVDRAGRPELRMAELLVITHVIAVGLAVFSLAVLIPNPSLWEGLPGSTWAYGQAMEHGGPLHIVLGAAAMVTIADVYLGRRQAMAWFLLAAGLSLCMELLGTGTGWPFGNYAYTFGLGAKILGRVPWPIPLSWFYISFCSWVLTSHALAAWRPGAPRWMEIAGSTWLLTAWDLVLDPAMAHPDQRLSFWVWHQRGAYLGMPIANLIGWLFTGVMIVGGVRLLARLMQAPLDALQIPVRPVLVVYLVNLAFGAALCLAVGLYLPIVFALVAGAAPASLALRPAPERSSPLGH